MACQTIFKKEDENPGFCCITLVFQWIQEIDKPITSISFVLCEKNKKKWHSPGGKDNVLVFHPNIEEDDIQKL